MTSLLLLASAILLPGAAAASDRSTAPNHQDDAAELRAVLSQLESEIEHHLWLRILDRSDPSDREAKTVRVRKAHAAYITELLGIAPSALLYADGTTPVLVSRGLRFRDLRVRSLFSIPDPGMKRNAPRTDCAHVPESDLTTAHLDQIRRISWERTPIVASPTRRIIPGTATLRSGRKVSMMITLVKRPGGWLLIGQEGRS